MSEWVASKATIGTRKAICHRYNHSDTQLCGVNGFISQTGPDSFKALIDNHKTFNKLAPEFGITFPARKGEERFIEFGFENLSKMIRAVKVPLSQDTQIQLSQRFSDPVKPGL